MRKAGLAVLLTGLFVLMLSALVVTPEDALPHACEPVTPILHAVFLPATEPPAPASALCLMERADMAPALMLCAAVIATAPAKPSGADSNGRVILTRRYENSVHQLFRPEVAGG